MSKNPRFGLVRSVVLVGVAGCVPAEHWRGPFDTGGLSSVDEPVVAACADPLLVRGDDVSEPLVGAGVQPFMGGNPASAIADFDGDGWLDLAVFTPFGVWSFFRNGGDGRILADGILTIDTTDVLGGTGVAAGDLDGDGDTDLVLGTSAGAPDRLLFNDGGGVFTVVAMEGTQDHETTTPTLADFDGDGDLDLLMARYAAVLDVEAVTAGELDGTGNAVYVNDGHGRFEWAPDAIPADVVTDVTFHAAVVDVDGDGALDLYFANDFGMVLDPNRLLMNDGSGRFTLASDCGCDLAMAGMGVGVGDVNGDRAPDLFATDLGGPELLNNLGDGTFYQASSAMGATVPYDPEHLASWGTSVVDLNQDGWEDLAMVFGPLMPHGDPGDLSFADPAGGEWVDEDDQRDVLLVNDGGRAFRDVSSASGFDDPRLGRVLAVGDLDRDGRPDLVTAGIWYAQTWMNRGGCEGGVTVSLQHPTTGVAVGAQVDAHIGDRVLRRWMLPSTTWSSSAPEVYIGLGDADAIDRLTVTWLDGRVDEWSDVQAGVVTLSPGG